MSGNKPACPCGSRRTSKAQVSRGRQLWHCHGCGGKFDPIEIAGRIEGGDYDDRRPDARLVREERGREPDGVLVPYRDGLAGGGAAGGPIQLRRRR